MANLRSFTGFLALDVLGTQTPAPGLTFDFPAPNQLDILIQDGDAILEGDSAVQEQSADPQGDQIGFITNSDGETLLDGEEVYLESSFTFTVDGAGSFTGYIVENEGSSQSFVVLPPNVPTGQIAIVTVDEGEVNVAYSALGSGDEDISQNDFANLDLSGADTINGGGGDDTIDAGEGDDSVAAGDGGDTVFGNAGGDTVDGGAGDDSIRGDSGEDGVTTVRESFNWAQLGLNSGDTIPNNEEGIDQNTGNITVNLDYSELERFTDFEYRNDFTQNTSGIDTGGEAIGNDVGFLVGDGTSPPGDTIAVDFNFSANTAGFEDEVRNVQFRINDVDDLTWRDIIVISAFDAGGDPVHVVLTGGVNITLSDEDGVNGLETATANNTNSNNQPADLSNSLLVEIPGPVKSINIRYGNEETAGQRVDITDIFFDAVPTAIANVETGDDSLLGGSGDDTIFGEAGEDTIDGGTDNDSIEGGANDDLLVINDDFGDDTITGGEIGETTGDTLDGGGLTQAVDVQYTGDEAATFTNNQGSDGEFSQIEHINTGSGDDTIDGTLDGVGIDLNAGAGADTILGGQAGDTLNAGSGADTIDGQAGDDTINAGDDADEIRLTDGFDNDSIVGGEGGDDSDTVSGATLTENVVVTYDGDESGNFVGQTSGDNAAFDEIEGVTTGSGDDTVDASADSTGQIITTNTGTDSILGGSGGDTIDAGGNNDNIDGGAGADSIEGGGGADSVLGGTGNDTILGGGGNDTIDGGEGADSISGVSGPDQINLTGNFGDDTVVGGEAGTDNDTLDGSTLTEAIDVTFSGDEAGNFTGQTTGSDATFSEIEAINTGSGDDTIDGSANTAGSVINTGAGDDTVLGGSGTEILTTGSGDDTVDGGQGTDSVSTGDGDDELRISDNFGSDTLVGGEGDETTGDTLAGGGLTEDVTVTFAADENGTVTNDGGDSADFAEIERVETGSGEDTIDATASTGGVDVDSGEGDDTITGGSGADTLAAAGGSDTINGGEGDDSITAGDGDDVIQLTADFDNDTVVGGEGGETNGDTLDGSTLAEDVVVTYDGDEQGNFVGQGTGDNADFAEIEAINTGSGADTIDASADNAGINVQTNAGADSVTGGGGDDQIATGTGADTVDGGAGADTISTGDDADLIGLTGDFGDDSIDGGGGGGIDSDTLDGGALTENIVVTFDGDESGNFVDQTTGSDAAFDDIEAINTGSGDDTIDGSANTARATFNTGAGADSVLGGTGIDIITAGSGDDTIDGGQGSDSVAAGDGDDELRITDNFGDDSLFGGEGAETTGDTLAGGGLTEDVTVTFNNDGESGTVTNPGGDTSTFAEIEAVETGSGADTIDASGSSVGVNVDSGAGDDTITGGEGDDTFAAGAGDDTVAAGPGNDSITAGDGDDDIILNNFFGDDTIVGGEGAENNGGDEIDASAVTEPVTVLFDGDEQGTITGDNTGDQATFSEIEEITTGTGDDTVDATADTVGVTINTGAGDDTVLGGQGGDTLNTGTGQDTVNGGAGADSINAGDDQDTIQLTNGFGDDTIVGGEGGVDADTLDGSALTENVDVTVNADGESGTVENPGGDNATFSEIEAISTGSGDDTVDASAATVGVNVDTGAGQDTITGGTGDDTLAAGEGADTVDGGLGADSVTGGGGDDELRINDQFGDDTIVGGETGETNGDTLAGGGLTENVTVTFNNDGESGTVTNPGGDSAQFSEIEAVETGSGDDTIDASGSPVGVNVDSGAGADTITGGAGDDTFAAGAGDDTIAAGEGADSITGGDGDDDIVLTDNFDNDTIVGGEGGETNGDEIDASAVTEPVTVLFDGDEQGTITGDNTGDTATFSEIEQITTGTGDDTVDASADSQGVTINTGAGDDTVLGGQGGDTLTTGTGQDTVNGGAGADSIDAGDDEDTIQLTDGFGDDTIAGGEGGNDSDTLAGGALTEAVTVTFNADDESGTVTNPGGDTATFSEIEAVETGSGDDTIDGSASTGGINADAGAGDDTITGGAGDDTLAAGEGADTVDGGLGADSITGGDGDDELRISDMFGDDTIIGGEGDETNGDTLAGGGLTEDVEVTFNADGESGTVTNPGGDTATFSEIEAVQTGSGDDTIDASGSPVGVNADAGAGDDTITGGDGADTLSGGAGLDTIDGGAGADSIDAGADDDSIQGGAGADTIVGGDGADTIDGGEDNDFLTGGDEDDLFIYMAGQGDDTITDFNFGNTGALGDGDPTNNDFIDLTAFYTNLTEARADIADDGVLNQSVGDFTDNTLLDGSITLAGVNAGGLTTDNTGLANPAGDFPHIVQGADGGAGVNQDGDNVFDDGRFYVEFIDNTGPTANLADLGFDTLDGSLGTAVPYNAGTTDDIDITNQTGTFGNDGNEFGARITTTLDVTTAGTYTFTTTSDDGSILYINGTQVVNNDGLHSSQTASGTIDLVPGQFEITVLYFENGGVENLSATIQGPDTGGAQLSLNDPAVNVRANAGAETVSGGAGDDTFLAGEGDDVLFGQDDQDTFLMTNGFDSDTITGGEGGTDVDTVDSSALSNGVNVVYSGDEAGTLSDPFDTALFTEIEVQILTAQDDTLDASNDTVGVNVFAGAGDDTLLGGDGGDTIRGEAGQDTLAGEAGADSLTGGDDEDVFIVNDQFGDDTIVGGEGGGDNDTIEGSALTENVIIVYDGDEQGSITNPGGDNADFSEIEAIRTGSGEDTVDASADTVGTDIATNAGDDTITGGSGADSLDAGADNDSVDGGAGDDTIIGGAGNDTINGGAGTDSIDAGDDDDVIDGGDNTDTIFGGDGNDSITDTGGALSDDTIFGGAGDDTIDGGIREDAIDGGDGDDLINLTGVFGDDTIVGGEAGETNGDTVSGSTLSEDVTVLFDGDEQGVFVSQAANGIANFEEIEAVETGLGDDTVDATQDTTGVTIITNEGEDVITGGAGDDSIDAGDDDDTITFGQNDTVLGGAGADEFIIQPTTGAMSIIGDFDPSTNVDNTVIYDPLNPPNQDDNDFIDLSSFFANINELRAANTPNGDGDVVLDLGDGQTLTFVGVSDVTLLNFENTNVICFTRGAKIRTVRGDVPVEDLREGDLVETMDSGAQPIRWIGRRLISAGMLETTPRLRPIRIAKGALGNTDDLMVSPQHRMLLSGERAEMMFGVDEVLASAKDLVDGDRIHMGPAEDVEYFHILFDDHEIIFAEGAATESFHPGEQALSTTTARMQAEIFELFPELAEECVLRPTARMVLKSHEAKAFVR